MTWREQRPQAPLRTMLNNMGAQLSTIHSTSRLPLITNRSTPALNPILYLHLRAKILTSWAPVTFSNPNIILLDAIFPVVAASSGPLLRDICKHSIRPTIGSSVSAQIDVGLLKDGLQKYKTTRTVLRSGGSLVRLLSAKEIDRYQEVDVAKV